MIIVGCLVCLLSDANMNTGVLAALPVPGADRAVRGDGDRAHGHSQLAIVARYVEGIDAVGVERARSLRRATTVVAPICPTSTA